MKMQKRFVRVLVLFLGLLISGGALWAGGQQAEESQAEAGSEMKMEAPVDKGGINDTYEFFNSNEYAHLNDPNPVYKTMTYDQMIKLFESEGTYMVLFGGSWCGNTQAVIGQINDVAKEYGVKTIYNFDWRIDGKSGAAHLRDNNNEFRHLYVDMVNTYLPNIVTIADREKSGIRYTNEAGEEALANKMYVPFLMVYNKDNKDANGNPAPIVAQYEEMFVWEDDFQTDGKDDEEKIEAYRRTIRPLFDYISKDGVAQLDYMSDFDYFSTAYNAKAGTTILDESDKPWVIETASYVETTRILDSEGTYVFIFGGPWCGNTRAVIKYVNEYAKKYNIDTVYNYDTRFDNSKYNLRDSNNPFAYLYVDMVRKYFPGIITETPLEKGIRYTNEAGEEIVANKLWVPYVFVYNKDNKDASGNPDPILGQIELMYTWDNIQPDYVDENGVKGANYKTYTEALDALFSLVK